MVVSVEYLWLDAKQTLRSKTRFFHEGEIRTDDILEPAQYPIWNFDGSSTGQATGEQTEILLHPVKCILHPFHNSKLSVLALCECYDPITNKAHSTNSRAIARELFDTKNEHKIWFGVEQEFFICDKETNMPLHWNIRESSQGEYYCGINHGGSIEREIMEEFAKRSIESGIRVSGFNQEVAHAQWEYQIGPVKGIDAADQLVFAKYILFRICEKRGVFASFHPKHIDGDWNGSGCHINISTNGTRNDIEMKEIKRIIHTIGTDHEKWMGVYDGNNNHLRLSGEHETSDPSLFTWGIGTRHTSIRIPNQVAQEGKGYFEDRRPGSSIDYYLTLSKYCEYI